jgi:hypothetical protein
MRRLAISLAIASLIAMTAASPALAADPPFTTVLGGLHNPRGLAFGANGRLYVAEAGLGSGTTDEGIGFNGSIDEIKNPDSNHPKVRTVVWGLASHGSLEGETEGIDGISVQGNNIVGIMAESQDATGDASFGKLLKVTPSGTTKDIANVGSLNYAWTGSVVGNPAYDPGDQYPDSNPYGVLSLPGRQYVVDAGANTLNEVRPDGTVRILAFFPNIYIPEIDFTTDATPTCVAKGPDGALYIGTLALVPCLFEGPVAKIYRVDPSTLGPGYPGGPVPVLGPQQEWATGFWSIHGIAFGPDGSLYVSELFTHVDLSVDFPFSGGDVKKLPFAHPSQHISLTNDQLSFPAGVAVGPHGAVYVVNGSTYVEVGGGEVVRLTNH